MFKKLASVFIAASMILSATAFAANAAEDAAVAADEDSAAVAADAESGETGASGHTLSFDTKSANWNNFKKAFCYIWEYNDGEFYAWGAKKTRMEEKDNGVWTFDLDAANISLESGKEYAVIFSNDNGMQTYDLLVGPECYGDTAYCDGTTYENPADSNKTGTAAFWKGQSKEKFGPVLTVTSIGNVVGTCLRPSQTKYSMFVSFLKDKLDNARSFSKKNDQTLLDDTAKNLGLGQDDIEAAIAEAGVKVDWKKASSAASQGSNADAKAPAPNAGGSSNNNSAATNNNGGSSNTNNNSSSGSNNSSNGSSNSSSSVASGQETTILFVFGGVMLAAAGVFFLARKKRED